MRPNRGTMGVFTMKTEPEIRQTKDIERDLIESNLQRVQPGDEVGRMRVIKDAAVQARQLRDLVALIPQE